MSIRNLLLASALSGALAVMMGAFGAHFLKGILSETALATWHTAVFYQLSHSLLLMAVCVRLLADPQRRLLLAAHVLILGVVLFSGSLYGLALGGPSFLGPITPLGGFLLILGWLFIAAYAVRLPALDR